MSTQCLNNFSRFLVSISLAYTISIMPVNAQQIIPDGNTATSLNVNGYTTTVSTTTIKNNNAFNSFKKFNVDRNNIVNLVVPDNVDNLINLVTGEESQIEGILNSIKDNHIGGNIFLLNPKGIVIGENGVVNVGSLTAITPTEDFTNNFFDAPNMPNDESVISVLNSTVPLPIVNKFSNPHVTNYGKINAITNVKIDTGYFDSQGGEIYTGAYFQENNISIGDVVNINNLETATNINQKGSNVIITANNIDLSRSKIVTNGGNVILSAFNNIDSYDSSIITNDSENIHAGNINLTAGSEIELEQSSLKAKSDGLSGDIDIKANIVDFTYNNIEGNNILIKPDFYLMMINDQINAENILTLNSGNVYIGGINFRVKNIKTKNLNSNFLCQNAPLNITSMGYIWLSGLDNIEINGTKFNPSSISLVSENDYVYLSNVSTLGDISLQGKEVALEGNLSGENIIIKPQNKLFINNSILNANNLLQLNGGNIKENGIVFLPEEIKAKVLESDFLTPNSDLNITSDSFIEIGNLNNIFIDDKPLNISNINLNSQKSIELSGNIIVPGDITITGSAFNLYPIQEEKAEGGYNYYYSHLEANNITINPDNGLEIMDNNTIIAHDTLTLNSGKTYLSFVPGSIKTKKLISNFLNTNDDLTITHPNFKIGNLHNVLVDGKPIIPTNLNLNAILVYLGGDLITKGDININTNFGFYVSNNHIDSLAQYSLQAKNNINIKSQDINLQNDVDLNAGNNIILDANYINLGINTNLKADNNIEINANNFLRVGNLNQNNSYKGGDIIAGNKLILNTFNIEENGLDFYPNYVQAKSLESNFLKQNNIINLTSTKYIMLGNLHNMIIDNKPLIPTDIYIKSELNAGLVGDVTASGDIIIKAEKVFLGYESDYSQFGPQSLNLQANNLTANPELLLNVSSGSIINVDNHLILNSGSLIQKDNDYNNFIFVPDSISCKSLESNFLKPDSSFVINNYNPIAIGNLDNIKINNRYLNPTNIDIKSDSIIVLIGDITATGDINLTKNQGSFYGSDLRIANNANIRSYGDINLNVSNVDLKGTLEVLKPSLLSEILFDAKIGDINIDVIDRSSDIAGNGTLKNNNITGNIYINKTKIIDDFPSSDGIINVEQAGIKPVNNLPVNNDKFVQIIKRFKIKLKEVFKKIADKNNVNENNQKEVFNRLSENNLAVINFMIENIRSNNLQDYNIEEDNKMNNLINRLQTNIINFDM